jgi:hypothetical protein
LQWLDVQSLIAATKVCKEWHAAVTTMAPGYLSIEELMEKPVVCAIGRHITTFTSSLVFTYDDIEALVNVAPRITHAVVYFHGSSTLHVNAVARLKNLTSLHMSSYSNDWIGLAPLAACPSLTALEIDTRIYWNISEVMIGEIRALGHLHTFAMSCIFANPINMRRIVAIPHTLAWKNIGWIDNIDSAEMLVALPSLTTLHGYPYAFSPSVLASLPLLHSLCVQGTCGLTLLLSGENTLKELIVHIHTQRRRTHTQTLRISLKETN